MLVQTFKLSSVLKNQVENNDVLCTICKANTFVKSTLVFIRFQPSKNLYSLYPHLWYCILGLLEGLFYLSFYLNWGEVKILKPLIKNFKKYIKTNKQEKGNFKDVVWSEADIKQLDRKYLKVLLVLPSSTALLKKRPSC